LGNLQISWSARGRTIATRLRWISSGGVLSAHCDEPARVTTNRSNSAPTSTYRSAAFQAENTLRLSRTVFRGVLMSVVNRLSVTGSVDRVLDAVVINCRADVARCDFPADVAHHPLTIPGAEDRRHVSNSAPPVSRAPGPTGSFFCPGCPFGAPHFASLSRGLPCGRCSVFDRDNFRLENGGGNFS
jgi:hypothetical protein